MANVSTDDITKANLATLVADISTNFINTSHDESISITIDDALRKIGNYLSVDRAYVFLIDKDRKKINNSSEWCRPGVASLKQDENNLPIDAHPWVMGQLQKKQPVAISNAYELPKEASAIKNTLLIERVKSMLAFPMFYKNELIGLVGFDSMLTEKKWSDKDLQILKMLSDIFVSALQQDKLQKENKYLKTEISKAYNFDEIISENQGIKNLLTEVMQVGPTDATVLIMGESGTGKELLARSVHQASLRKDQPLIKVNCAALPANLIESELFGHEKGAFTGAIEKRIGRFELAHNGTIFFDEIGELPLELQPKLLRALQEGEFERLGGTKTIKINTRIIAATNRDLEEQVVEGKFREDLYYRLNVFPLYNPPLRERKEDIPVLVNHFCDKFSKQLGKRISNVPKDVMKALAAYDWPGNIRELQNIIERAVIITQGNSLQLGNWNLQSKTPKHATSLAYRDNEKMHLLKVLNLTNWKISGPKGAAEKLKLNPKTLESKMRKLGIRRDA